VRSGRGGVFPLALFFFVALREHFLTVLLFDLLLCGDWRLGRPLCSDEQQPHGDQDDGDRHPADHNPKMKPRTCGMARSYPADHTRLTSAAPQYLS
jgi:hypothetical protein